MSDRKKALQLSYFTVIYNILEGLVSVIFGSMANSIALVSFGLDSFIESLSGGIMIWRFKKHKDLTPEREEKIENTALKLVGYTFFILAIYIGYESFNKLYFKEIPEPSVVGIIIAILSLIIMPILYLKKHDVGHQLNSHSLMADAKQTFACMFLSIALLLGLALNHFFGFWQADPIVGFVAVVVLIREGYLVLKKKQLCLC
tara:strand:+ start:217 stop:822 length:606 start_codon:yes stop_codon:yes gene_type:complete